MEKITFSFSKKALLHLLLLLALVLSACSAILGDGDGEDGEDTGGGGGGGIGGGLAATEEPTILVGSDGGSILYVDGGPFIMGSEEDDPGAEPDEMPQHRLNVLSFWIQQVEVSNAQYLACVAEGECDNPLAPNPNYDDPGYGNHPVVGVNWYQAQNYCEWLGGRLPTEAEWEKTARGLLGQTYPWGEDDPDCTLTNKQGCNPEGTDPVGARLEGLSPFEALDMAGNVGEWTYDWYTSSYSEAAMVANPLGATDGLLKVWRGGGFSEDDPQVRTPDRNALDPDEALPNLGFRCVLANDGGETARYAPFCRDTYIAYCNPGGGMETGLERPDRPADGEDPNLRVTGFGCPQRGVVDVSVDLGIPLEGEYTVTVAGQPFGNCYTLPEYPGRLYCNGPAPTMGATVEVTVCEGGASPQGLAPAAPSLVGWQPPSNTLVGWQPPSNTLVGWQPPSNTLVGWQPPGNTLVGYTPPQQQTTGPGTDQYCPQGYTYNPLTGQCDLDETQEGCPEGWAYNPDLYRCEPEQPSDCPEGSVYDEKLGRCVTSGDECAEGFTLTHLAGLDMRACEPPANDDGGGLCPLGYFFDPAINCCSLIPETDFGCDEGYMYDSQRQACVPLDTNGCPVGTAYDPYRGCVQTGNGQTPDGGQCPEGTHLANDGLTCEPDSPTATNASYVPGTACPEGYAYNDAGQCVPADGTPPQNCNSPLAYYDPNLENCVETPDGCGLGYYFDTLTQSCLPTSGPGSQCGVGYMFDRAANCCVPVPGTDGTECSDPNQNGQAPPTTYFAAAPTNFDYYTGYCTPPEGGCPDGYVYNENRQACVPVTTEEDCPEGTTYDEERMTCVPDQPGDCPEGYAYLAAVNNCSPDDTPPPACEEGYYFNPQVGYCVPTDDGGCGVGYLAAPTANTCTPTGDDPNGECPDGYYFSPNLNSCVPMGGGNCWTVQIDVPVCQQPTVTPDPRCGTGKRWSEETQSCENVRDDPTPTPGDKPPADSCDDYTSPNSCNADPDNVGNCQWYIPTTGGQPYCNDNT